MAAMGGGPPKRQRTADDDDVDAAPDVDGAAAQADRLEQVRAELRATEAMLRKRLEQDKLKVQQSLLPPPPDGESDGDGDVVSPVPNPQSSSDARRSASIAAFSTARQPSSSVMSSTVGPTPPSGLLLSSGSLIPSSPLPPPSFLPPSSVLASTSTNPSPPTTIKPQGNPETPRMRKISTSSSGSWSTRPRIGIDMLLNDTEPSGAQEGNSNQATERKDGR